MNRKIFYSLVRLSLVVQLIVGPVFAKDGGKDNAFNSTMNTGSGIIAPDQIHNGNWSPSKYIENGWSGYHVIVKTLKRRNYVKYYSGETCKDGKCSRDSALAGPLCSSGDCEFKSDAQIFKIDSGAEQKGTRVAQETILGLVKSFDNGSVEQTLVQNPQSINILRIDEVEAQSKLKMDEAQVQTFIGFDKIGNAFELGHIEEADAPKMFNQPESIYRRNGQKDEFLTTVIERVIPTNQTDTENSEGMRIGTMWCDSDQVRLTKGLEKIFLYNDKFDFRDCRGEVKPIDSITSGFGKLKQAFTDRTNSVVTVLDTDTRKTGIQYKSVSDVSIISDNGTDYILKYDADIGGKKKEINLAYWNSKRYNWKEMENCPSVETRQSGKCNFPRAKLLSINWKKDPDFRGISDSDKWINNEHSESRGMLSSGKIELATQRVALVAYEKVGEVYTKADGSACAEKREKGSGWDSGERNTYVNPVHEAAYHTYGTSNYNYNMECNSHVSYTMHLYILFPSSINGKSVPELAKIRLLDKVLAAQPDQAQMSTELVQAEDYVDKILLLQKFNYFKNPQAITLADAVDIGTEEDHLTAQQKIWDLFGDLIIIGKSSKRIPDVFSTVQPDSNLVSPTINLGKKNETDL